MQPDLFSQPEEPEKKEEIQDVSELTYKIKFLLEDSFPDIMVQGEISTLKQSFNGHYYFTLKDEDAQLPCVMWRSTAAKYGELLEHGKHVILGGDIQVYPPHGKYQLIVNLVEEAGLGALQQAFERLKRKLHEEGLFNEALKKPIPKFSETIGVITSATGAAFQDIRSTLEARYPLVQIKLYHASVQGDRAKGELVKGVNFFNEKMPVDLIILGRGGGSLEDLWPFNEEIVARAIYRSETPVISAVGHEVDFSISDFVADARAATPTHAATLAVPDSTELKFKVDDLSQRIIYRQEQILSGSKERVRALMRTHALLAVKEKVNQYKELTERYRQRIEHTSRYNLMKRKETWQALAHRLEQENPKKPLEKGFTRILQEGQWIRKQADLQTGESFEIEWRDGRQEISPGKS